MSGPAVHKKICIPQPGRHRYVARKMLEEGIDQNDIIEFYVGDKLTRTGFAWHIAREPISLDQLEIYKNEKTNPKEFNENG
jgi:hypothetical protein